MLFNISKEIVEVTISDLLMDEQDDFDSEEDDIVNGGNVNSKLVEIFCLSENEDYYEASWNNRLQFELIVSYISMSMSFRQCSRALEEVKVKCGLGAVGCVNREKISTCVHYVCAYNLQTIKTVLENVWEFSIAVVGGTKSTVPYLDIRIRFVVSAKLINIHLIALPCFERHTEENMFILLAKFLDALYKDWRTKLLSVCSDGASNMTGRYQGLVT